MCTYNLSDSEITSAVVEALDNLEGDFTRATLVRVLNKIKKNYKSVSNWTKETSHGYDYCPHCYSSFSLRGPGKDMRCPWCKKKLKRLK